MAVQSIFCDESGFTGNNLLNDQQPYFVYSSVAIEALEAEELVKKLMGKYRIRSEELKGSTLIKYHRGRKLISELIDGMSARSKVIVCHKKYALACKFFEYIFEPAISSQNSLFYNVGFHRFISNVIYVHFLGGHAGAEKLLKEFEMLMRGKMCIADLSVFSETEDGDVPGVMQNIRSFAIHNQRAIQEELTGLTKTFTEKWILDLTLMSLHSLLIFWGQSFDGLDVFCDEAKPLRADHPIFMAMVGRKDRPQIELEGRTHHLIYNLSCPIHLLNSKKIPGIQIADVIAAAFAHVFSKKDEFSTEWGAYLNTCLHEDSIFPEADRVDLNQFETQRNAILLEELTRRSIDKKNLLDGMPEYIYGLTQFLQDKWTQGNPFST